MDYTLDHVMELLTQKFIRRLHQILMTGTVDEYKEQVRPDKIHSSLAELIVSYERQTEIERNHILDFHVRFETQIEQQRLYAASRLYLPADYKED